MPRGQLELGGHGSLGPHQSTARFVIATLAPGESELREPLLDVARRQHLVLHRKRGGRRDGRLQEMALAVVSRMDARRGDHQDPAGGEQVDAGLALDLAPELVRALCQARIDKPLAGGLACDAGAAVRRSQGVRW